MIANVEKFRAPNKAYAKPVGSRFKSRWYNIHKSSKGFYIMLRGFRVYESEWSYKNEI